MRSLDISDYQMIEDAEYPHSCTAQRNYNKRPAMATKTINAKRVALLLVILVIDHVLQANSASFEPDPGFVFSGRRKLRKLPPPPAPLLSRAPHYMFSAPPPPPSTAQIVRNLRGVSKKAPPAPKLGRPRNFRIFLSPPPPPPPAPVQGRTSNCNIPPPPPKSFQS
ncbi:hypothetical protein LXL04_011606 [Taraxacum kok-saghyz]